jgi:predicted dehydrogenase
MINVALIGFGFAGRTFHAPLIEACAGLRLHTIATSQPDAVPPGVRATTIDEAIADPDIDLIVVATPNDTHAPLARRALEAGKAVVVDKPFTLTVAEAEALADLADDRGLLLSVFHNRRWDADFLLAKSLIAEDALGPIVRFESHFDRFRPQVRDRWREQAGPGSGVWFDLGPHLADQAIQLFGMPLGVTCDLAVMRPGAVAVDYAHAVLRYETARIILHADMTSAAADLRFSIHGARASLIKEGLDVQESQLLAGLGPGTAGWGEDPRPGLIVDGATGERREVHAPRGAYQAYYSAIAAALRGEGPNPVTPQEAIAVMKVIEASVESDERRAEVVVRP